MKRNLRTRDESEFRPTQYEPQEPKPKKAVLKDSREFTFNIPIITQHLSKNTEGSLIISDDITFTQSLYEANSNEKLNQVTEELVVKEMDVPLVRMEDNIPLVRDGVGSTLAYLKFVGNDFFSKPKNEIKITVDNPKEAYKELSHAFHGNKPGKRKLSKKLQHKNSTTKVENKPSTAAVSMILSQPIIKKSRIFGMKPL